MTETFDVFDEFDVMGQFTNTVAGDVRDPYPEFAIKRREAPVDFQSPDDGGDGAYVVYRYDDVDRVFRDNETYSSSAIRELMALVMGPYVLVGMDEPEHRRHRNLVSQAFRQKSLARWESLVVEIVNGHVDRFEGAGRAELVRELTFRFPVEVIAGILGVPAGDRARFHELAVAIVNVSADPERGFAASAAMREYLSEVVELRRHEPDDDVISDLVRAELDGEILDDEEIYSFLRLLLPAGAETTYRATGNLLYGLLTHPDQLAAVVADHGLLPQAVEETLRWEPPLLVTSRIATRDTELGGVAIPAGSFVVPNVGSANRDESRWDRPDEFDIFREPKAHIAFATGVHQCLGLHLARLEMKWAVSTLLDRLPDLRLDPDPTEPGTADPHIHGERFRSPTSLPVLF